MTVLTPALHRELRALLDGATWGLGDWAIKVAGPPGTDGVNDGSRARIDAALAEFADVEGIARDSLPSAQHVAKCRQAAAAISPRLRSKVRDIEAGALLAQITDAKDRARLIVELADTHPKGIVTRTAVQDYLRFARTKKQPAKGRPLAANFWRFIGQTHKWSDEVAFVRDHVVADLDGLTDTERDRVAEALIELRDAVEALVRALGDVDRIDEVEDGQIIDATADDIIEITAA